MLDSSSTAVKGTLQRGRASLARQRVAASHQPVGGRGSAAERDLASRFAVAFTAGDVGSVIALLTDDAWLSMPPAPHEYVGYPAIAGFLRTSTDWRGRRRLRLVPTRANGQPAFGCYLSGEDDPTMHPAGILVLTMSGERISTITRFLDNDLHQQFGLPDQILAQPGSPGSVSGNLRADDGPVFTMRTGPPTAPLRIGSDPRGIAAVPAARGGYVLCVQ